MIPSYDWPTLVTKYGFPSESPCLPDYAQRPCGFQESECQILLCLIDALATKPTRILEFGTYEGSLASLLLRHVPSVRHYVGIDRPCGGSGESRDYDIDGKSRGFYAQQDARFSLLLCGGGTGSLDADILPRHMHVCIIDGDHRRPGVEHDTELARCSVATGGILVWHDYDRHHDGVWDFLNQHRSDGYNIESAGALAWEFL